MPAADPVNIFHRKQAEATFIGMNIPEANRKKKRVSKVSQKKSAKDVYKENTLMFASVKDHVVKA